MTSAQVTANAGSVEDLTSDPYVYRSWYLDSSPNSDLSIDVESVWEDYTGRGVSVGVLDTQIDFNHRELAHAYDLQRDYNFAIGTDNVTINSKEMTDNHGTMVAGVISAEGGNGVGSVGVASGATLIGLGIDYSSSSVVDDVLQGLRAAVSLDVVNNSWSFGQNFKDNFNRAEMSAMADAVEHAATAGRGGLGTNLVFSAGNSDFKGASNYHNFQNSPYTIAVGAVEKSGDAWDSTSLGANVLLSAAGVGVYTTHSNNRYVTATGTSFAAPAVSAAVALMLEANSELGYRDIQQILALSSRKDMLGAGSTMGIGWIETGVNNVNGGAAHFNDAFGYGFLNVHDAVRLAETWGEQRTAANMETLSVLNESGATLIAGQQDHITLDFSVDQAIEVEHVQLTLGLVWRNSGDLDVYLTSPDGTRVQLVYANPDGSYIGSPRNFTFSSVASMGEMGEGVWTLDVYNRNPNAVESDGSPMEGTLRSATLAISGEADGLSDNIYVYTNEMGTLYRGDASRHVLSDTNGGSDTINAAAVTSGSKIDLTAGTARIAGVSIDIQTPDAFENIFGGDGNDTLKGHAGDDAISAGRGNDLLHMTSGNDTIAGDAGSDTLFVDSLFASITGHFMDTLTFFMDAGANALAWITGVEIFSFRDVTYSISDLFARFGGASAPAPEAPAPEAPAPEAPAPEAPAPEAPAPEAPAPEAPTPEAPAPEAPAPEAPSSSPFDHEFVGTDGDDKLRGTAQNDRISGAQGSDTLYGRDGADRLEGGIGGDKAIGGNGDDSILGGTGNDTLSGDAGRDLIRGDGGFDVIRGGAGADRLFGGLGNDKIRGDAGNDHLDGGAGRDVLTGGDGADVFIFDLADSGALDVITDFNAAEGDKILVTGLAGLGEIDFTLETRNGATFLSLDMADGTERLFKIITEGTDDLTINQQSADSFLIA